MKILDKFYVLQSITILVVLINLIGCESSNDNERLQRLINQGLIEGPEIKIAFLDISFGLSRIQYQKKLDSLYQRGEIMAIGPDSTLHQVESVKFYKYYYEFPDGIMKSTGKWLLTPTFENNRLTALKLINTPLIEHEIGRNIKGLSKGFLRTIVTTSKEVMDEAEITYRISKEYSRMQHGAPDYEIIDQNKVYWIKGNRQIVVTLNLAVVEILFKNS